MLGRDYYMTFPIKGASTAEKNGTGSESVTVDFESKTFEEALVRPAFHSECCVDLVRIYR